MNDVEVMNKDFEEWKRANKTTLQAAYAEAYFPLFEEFCRETYLHDMHDSTPGKILWDVYDEEQERKRNDMYDEEEERKRNDDEEEERKRNVNEDDPRREL